MSTTPSQADKNAIVEVVNSWSFTRDQGRWDQCAATFAADGRIDVSWYHGPHTGFIEASRHGVANGFSKHMMLGTVASPTGSRAFAETSVLLSMRVELHGVSAVGTSLFRFLDRFERGAPAAGNASGWRIRHRSAVYDSDHFVPEFADEPIAFDKAELARLPRAYRYLAYGLRSSGLTVPLDLPTLGSPAEARIRAEALAWCAEGR